MIPRRFDTGSGAEPAQGGWTLDAEHQWVVEGTVDEIDDVAAALGPVARRAGRNVLLLRFGNGVGRYRAGQAWCAACPIRSGDGVPLRRDAQRHLTKSGCATRSMPVRHRLCRIRAARSKRRTFFTTLSSGFGTQCLKVRPCS